MAHTEDTTPITIHAGGYAAALRENVISGAMTPDRALKFLLDSDVHPRIATRILSDALSGVDPDTDR